MHAGWSCRPQVDRPVDDQIRHGDPHFGKVIQARQGPAEIVFGLEFTIGYFSFFNAICGYLVDLSRTELGSEDHRA